MNKKIVILIVICIVVIAAGVGSYLIIKKSPSTAESPQVLGQTPDQNNTTNNQGSQNSQPNVGQSQNKLVTDDFSIDLPDGWRKTAPVIGATAMAINADETISDPAVQKINFKSYVAVSYDTLQGKTMSEYLQNIKSELQRLISNAVFTKEEDININDRPAHAMEAEMTQQGVNFKVLMVVMGGEGEDVWVISFNTTKNNWDGYKETFYNIAKSFSLKK